ncbi:MAG: hypothetical protein IJB37_07000, partial [Peptococcaceae bacterium]|nr:hypothetical protein [Peptococcaceae bacterium]
MKKTLECRVIAMLLAVIMVFTVMPVTALPANAATATGNTNEFAGGTGTAEDPYLVSTKEHLNNVRFYLSAHFKMINDIEFADADFAEGGMFYNGGDGWEPLGYSPDSFSGTFDGNYHSITNLHIKRTQSNIGLFGIIESNAVVKNVCLIEADIIGNENVGGIAGRTNGATIINCYSKAYVQGVESVGAIVGGVYENSTIEACISEGTVSGTTKVGGISGRVNPYIDSSKELNATIRMCTNSAVISGESSVGGLLGDVYTTYAYETEYVQGTYGGSSYTRVVWYSPKEVYIENCYNAGTVKATSGEAGGIVGTSRYASGPYKNSDSNTHQSTLINCYNCGKVEATSGTYSVAKTGYRLAISNCYYLENSVTTNSGAGTKLTHNQMRAQSIFTSWNFNSVWTMKGSDEYLYPELQCFIITGTAIVEKPVVYGARVSVEVSSTAVISDAFTYSWFVDNTLVSNTPNYIISAEDIGKTLTAKVNISHPLLRGYLTSDAVIIGKAPQTAYPEVPELKSKTDFSFEITTVSTQEYSIDNVNWQTTGVFENLDPNKTYTVYSRILENDLYLLGESTEVLSVVLATCEHDFVEKEGTRIDATCMAAGSVTMACHCGAEKEVVLEIDPENHTGNTYVDGYVTPSCSTAGFTGKFICECGEIVVAGFVIPATGEHNFVEGSCDVCGAEDPNFKVEITAQPESAESKLDDYVTFTVGVNVDNVTYQWQYKAANSEKWRNSTAQDATTAALRVQMKAYRAGQQYRCIITTADGEVLTS